MIDTVGTLSESFSSAVHSSSFTLYIELIKTIIVIFAFSVLEYLEAAGTWIVNSG